MHSTLLSLKRPLSLAFALLSLGTSSALAADADNPCKRLVEACEAAKTKGSPMDCVKKLMDGGTIEGVSVSAEDIAACKAKKSKHADKNKS